MSNDNDAGIVSSESYRDRIAHERATYENNLEIHNLPEIFHYWSNEHVYPKLRQLGLEEDRDLFKSYLENCCTTQRPQARRFASFGAGNCDLEIELALHLEAKGFGSFVIDCIDLNQTMLDRGMKSAAEAGVSGRIACVQADLNKWTAAHEYDAVIANQSLHHLLTGSYKEPLIGGERLTCAGPTVRFGANLLHLRDIEKTATRIASIDSDGTFDGIVLSGIVASYLA